MSKKQYLNLLKGVDIAFFSAGGSISQKFAQEAVKRGAVVIDNTSAFRMDEGIPLVVPEVNPHALQNHSGIIANPNCSTIQMVAALQPIKEKFGINRIIVSTYQAVSGAGAEAIDELEQQSTQFEARAQIEAEIASERFSRAPLSNRVQCHSSNRCFRRIGVYFGRTENDERNEKDIR